MQPVQFIHDDPEPTDDIATVVEKIFCSDLQTLHDTQKALDISAIAERPVHQADFARGTQPVHPLADTDE